MSEHSPVNPPNTEQLWITPEAVAKDSADLGPQPPAATIDLPPAPVPFVLPSPRETGPNWEIPIAPPGLDPSVGPDDWFFPPRVPAPREEGEFDFGPEDWFGSPTDRVDLDPGGVEWDVDASGRRWLRVDGGTDWAPELEGWDYPIAEVGVEGARVGKIRRLGQFVGRQVRRLSEYDQSNISRRKARENRIKAVKGPGPETDDWVQRARKRNHRSPEEVDRNEHDLRINPVSFGARSAARFVMWNAGKLRRATPRNIADYAYEAGGHWHGIEGHNGGSGRFVPRNAARLVTLATRAKSPKRAEAERSQQAEIDSREAELREWAENMRESYGHLASPTEDDDDTDLWL